MAKWTKNKDMGREKNWPKIKFWNMHQPTIQEIGVGKCLQSALRIGTQKGQGVGRNSTSKRCIK
jgi:hypothetical protein